LSAITGADLPEGYARLPSLTGMRFAAAAMVFMFHAIWLNSFTDQALKHAYRSVFMTVGYATVSCFFILSGFVLTISHHPGDRAGLFWRRRFFRVYPDHILTFALALGGLSTQAYQYVCNIFLVQNWYPNYGLMISGNPVSWSLSCDAFFYACFPALILLAHRVRAEFLWWCADGAVLVIYGAACIAYFLIPSHPAMPDGEPVGLYQFWFLFHFPVVRVFEFVLGIIMARIIQTGRWPGIRMTPVVLLFVPLILLGLRIPHVFDLVALWVVPLALLLPAIATADIRATASWLRTRVMVRLGEISLAFYLTHATTMYFLLLALRSTLHGTIGGIALLVMSMAAAIAVAWLLYVLWERPIMRRFSRPRGRRRRAADTGTAARASI